MTLAGYQDNPPTLNDAIAASVQLYKDTEIANQMDKPYELATEIDAITTPWDRAGRTVEVVLPAYAHIASHQNIESGTEEFGLEVQDAEKTASATMYFQKWNMNLNLHKMDLTMGLSGEIADYLQDTTQEQMRALNNMKEIVFLGDGATDVTQYNLLSGKYAPGIKAMVDSGSTYSTYMGLAHTAFYLEDGTTAGWASTLDPTVDGKASSTTVVVGTPMIQQMKRALRKNNEVPDLCVTTASIFDIYSRSLAQYAPQAAVSNALSQDNMGVLQRQTGMKWVYTSANDSYLEGSSSTYSNMYFLSTGRLKVKRHPKYPNDIMMSEEFRSQQNDIVAYRVRFSMAIYTNKRSAHGKYTNVIANA